MRDPQIASMAEIGRSALGPAPGPVSLPALKSTRLLDQLRERTRSLHYSRSTEEVYVFWVRAFIRHHGLRHPRDFDGADVESFLTWVASERQVAAATHRQALSALLFLYGKVLGVQLPWMAELGQRGRRSGCSLRDIIRLTLAAVSFGAISCTTRPSSAPSSVQPRPQA